ncbi:MAG: amidohydrolase family protein [Eubacteriales bacterium]|nr:amidohydrolase family protein [Eubacteriales bacterium]
MKKIDIHIHTALQQVAGAGKNPVFPDYIADADEMREHLKNQQISEAVIMSAGENEGYIQCSNNEDAMKIVREHDGFFHWMCNVDARDPETIGTRLEQYKSQGAIGVGELMINQWIDSEILQEVFRNAERLELPVLFHMSPEPGYGYGICDHAGLPLLEKILQSYPKLKVIGHSQVFWHEISGDCETVGNAERSAMGKGTVASGGRVIELLDHYDNLYCDLSAYSGYCAISRDEEFGCRFLQKYEDRLLYGTDAMNRHQIIPLDRLIDTWMQEGKISRETFEKIYHLNAEKLFGI